jgi:DnaJ like chaperone protein
MDLRTFFTQNSFWGKILGAFFGFIMAGPAGALFGILVGNFFDRGLSKHFNNPYFDVHTQRHTQIYTLFLKTTFMVMGYLAKSDGRVSEKAILNAKRVMEELRLNKSQIADAKLNFNIGKSQGFDLITTLMTFKIACQLNHNLITHFLNIQYHATLNDNASFQKVHTLNQVFQFLGFAPMDIPFHTQQDPHSSSSQHHDRKKYPPTQNYHNFSLVQAYTLLN